MTKGQLMLLAFGPEQVNKVDPALPMHYWPILDKFWWCMDYNDSTFGKLTLLSDKAVARGAMSLINVDFGLQPGDILTTFAVSDSACNKQNDWIYLSEDENQFIVKDKPRSSKRWGIKKFNSNMLVFKNNNRDLPFCSDMKTNIWRMNAMMNFVGDISHQTFHDYVKDLALWPINLDVMARCMLIPTSDNNGDNEYSDMLLYPMFDTHCAPLDAVRARTRPVES